MICIFCSAQVASAPYCGLCGAKQKQAGMTLAQLHDDWAKVHYRKIGKKGIEGYENAWKSLSVYQQRKVDEISLEDYQAVMDTLSNKSYSLQQKLYQLVGQLCEFAKVKKIDTVNYAPFLVLDGYRNKSRHVFSDREIARLFSYIKANGKLAQEARIVMILIFTGLRPEELFSVRKEDVHFGDKYFVAKGSKTAAGRDRLIPIVPIIAPYIFSFWMTHRATPELITSPKGCRVNLGNWRKRKFFPLMLALGINTPDNPHRLVPYCTRHTYATLADRAGVDHDTLAKLIGHVDYALTKKVYIHERLDEFRIETDKVAALATQIVASPDAVA